LIGREENNEEEKEGDEEEKEQKEEEQEENGKEEGKEGGSRVTFLSYQLPCLYLSTPAGLVIISQPNLLNFPKDPFERPQQLLRILERDFRTILDLSNF